MHTLMVGLNYRTAPVEIREKLTFDPDSIAQAMKELKGKKVFLKILSFQLVIGQKYML